MLSPHGYVLCRVQADGQASNQQELHRLFQERARLLQTAAYTQEDPLIVQMSRRIQQLQAC